MFHHHRTYRPAAFVSAIAAAALALAAATRVQDPIDEKTIESPAVNPKWLERMERLDRALLDANIGFAPPAITDTIAKDLIFVGAENLSWDSLRGKVVVIQSWTSRTEAGRSAPARAQKALETLNVGDFQIIAVHTPEGSDTAEVFLERRPLEMPVVIDRGGMLLDELGMYRRPANAVIDRNGMVRFAGLNAQGLAEAAALLAAEPFEPEKQPQPREAPATDSAAEVVFPADTGTGGSARNIRGQRGPDFFVQQWLNGRPDANNKVVIVDFWATWCGPCVASIPHMNELAARHPRDLLMVGLSDEPSGTVMNFMRQTRMEYAVATDPTGRMKNAIAVSGIPHAIVMSSDWIVRWQGHPATLTAATLDAIVRANSQLASSSGNAERYRWSRGDED